MNKEGTSGLVEISYDGYTWDVKRLLKLKGHGEWERWGKNFLFLNNLGELFLIDENFKIKKRIFIDSSIIHPSCRTFLFPIQDFLYIVSYEKI